MAESDTDNKPRIVVGSVAKPGGQKTKWLKWLVILFLVAGVIYAGWVLNNDRQTKATHNICVSSATNDVLGKVASSPNADIQTQLKATVAKIQVAKNYQKDANCLYVVVTYYISISDVSNANTYLKQLEKVYDAKQGFDTKLSNATSLDVLKDTITAQQKTADEVKSNTGTFANP